MTSTAASAPDFRSTPAAEAHETLLCLHSSGSSGRQWAVLQPLLSPHLRVLAPELLGYGDAAPWPAGMAVSLDEEAERLQPLLGAGGAHLFGHVRRGHRRRRPAHRHGGAVRCPERRGAAHLPEWLSPAVVAQAA